MIKSVREIAHLIEGELIGDPGLLIKGVANIEDAKDGDITFALNGKYLGYAYNSKATAIIVSNDIDIEPRPGVALIKVENPRFAFLKALELFTPRSRPHPQIHPTAFIGNGSKVGREVWIGPYVVVGEDVRIEDGVIIYHHVSIGDEVEIGQDSIIYPQVTLYRRSKIGKGSSSIQEV